MREGTSALQCIPDGSKQVRQVVSGQVAACFTLPLPPPLPPAMPLPPPTVTTLLGFGRLRRRQLPMTRPVPLPCHSCLPPQVLLGIEGLWRLQLPITHPLPLHPSTLPLPPSPPQVRHYWDSEDYGGRGVLYLAFAQSRLPYGFEYDGRPLDPVSLPLLLSVPGLLAAVNALQTSPVVSLGLPAGQGSCREAVAALAGMAGKYHVSASLSVDSTPQVCAGGRCGRWCGEGERMGGGR